MDDVPVTELAPQLRLERGDRVLLDVGLVVLGVRLVGVDLVGGRLGTLVGRLVALGGVGADILGGGVLDSRRLDGLDRRDGVLELRLGARGGLLRLLRHVRTCFLLRVRTGGPVRWVLDPGGATASFVGTGAPMSCQPPKTQNVSLPMPRSTTVTKAMTTATNTSTTLV